jgi:hypothetical protein
VEGGKSVWRSPEISLPTFYMPMLGLGIALQDNYNTEAVGETLIES